MSLEINQVWTSTAGSSGGFTALQVMWPCIESVMYVQHSTMKDTNSWSVQTAQESSGPWYIEGTAAVSTAVSTQAAIRFTGPYVGWVRPYLHATSTGTWQFRLVGGS